MAAAKTETESVLFRDFVEGGIFTDRAPGEAGESGERWMFQKTGDTTACCIETGKSRSEFFRVEFFFEPGHMVKRVKFELQATRRVA